MCMFVKIEEIWETYSTWARRLKSEAQKDSNRLLKPDLCRAEPCFEIRSLHVLRSSTLLPSVLRADWTSEFCDPPPCPGAIGGDDGEKSSPESSVKATGNQRNIRLKRGLTKITTTTLIASVCFQSRFQWRRAGLHSGDSTCLEKRVWTNVKNRRVTVKGVKW